jgi:hypothetical protein
MKITLPVSVYNWTTVIGATLAIISLFMIVFLFIVSVFIQQGSSYLGLIIYIVLPAFLVSGLVLIPIGMIAKTRRDRRSPHEESLWPVVDLNKEAHRNAFIIFSAGTTLFLLLSAIGSYEAFTFTESVEFCGTICHSVMRPEFTAYQNSPHAKVACVECHVGAGADWYMRSKLSGLYQVYSVTFHKFPTPIPTPISNLRPARETCERCHWPSKFYGQKLVVKKYYLNDEQNTPWQINMAVKIGSSHSASALQEGIHWHINPDVAIEYKASDLQRQTIGWVKRIDRTTGAVTVFEDTEHPIEKRQFDSLQTRTMDCMDCHNRPSHNYMPPQFFLDQAMAAGRIPTSLPFIKKLATDLVAKDYGTTDSALAGIKSGVDEFYRTGYPQVYEKNRAFIAAAGVVIGEEYGKNLFPEMKVKWSAYPSNLGHMEFNGCFRCHDGNHKSADGKLISKDCNLCHTIYGQGNPASLVMSALDTPLEFAHPVEIGDAWKESVCTTCHTGVNP